MTYANTPASTSTSPSRLSGLVPAWGSGIILTGLLALASFTLAQSAWAAMLGLSSLTIAIVLGLVVGNTVFPSVAGHAGSGVDFCKNRVLRAGIILYGFRITFQQIGDIGWAGAVIDVVMIATTFTLALQLGTRVFGLDRQTATLIGAGSAICGAAAVMATEPVVRAPAHKVSVAIATVVVFGTLAMFLYPLLYSLLGMSEHAYGVYAGSTIHEVAQVVVAGKAVGDTAATTAVIEKMLRVMMLAPFLLLLSGMSRPAHGEEDKGGDADTKTSPARHISIPWFAVLFVVASGIHSLGWIPAPIVAHIVQIDTILLTMAMAALGLRTQAGAIRQAGLKPLLLAACLFVFLVVGGFAVNAGVTWLFAPATATLPA